MNARKKRPYTLIIVLLCLGIAFIGYRLFQPPAKSPIKTQVSNCGKHVPANALLSKSDDPILHKLSEYETVCQGAISDTMMFFTAMPTSNEEAMTFAKNTADRLKEFAKYNIKPLISFEPNITIPTIINDIHSGKYDAALSLYFQRLKENDISIKELGTWVLFPEANTPTWHNSDPSVFAANVTKVATIQRHVFPNSKLTILLNNTTYAGDDEEWSRGLKEDLSPYIDTIPKGTLDSIGYQGFPYVAPEDRKVQHGQLDAKDFLPIHLARDAAKKLQTKNIWINTGTFQRAHTDTDAGEVKLSLSQRKQTLDSITNQVTELKKESFTVSLNLFAKDKTNEQEHIDWSYWSNGNYTKSPNTPLFKAFVTQLREHNIHLSLHDAM